MFTKAGNTPVTIGKIIPADPKFSKDPNAFDLHVQVTGENGESDYAMLEYSGDYGKGNFADRTQAQISADTLRKLGWEGSDLSELFVENHPLLGKRAIVHIEESKPNADGKTFMNVKYFVTGGREPEKIGADVVKARLAALMAGGGQAAAPARAPAASTSTAKPSPFGRKPFPGSKAAAAKEENGPV